MAGNDEVSPPSSEVSPPDEELYTRMPIPSPGELAPPGMFVAHSVVAAPTLVSGPYVSFQDVRDENPAAEDSNDFPDAFGRAVLIPPQILPEVRRLLGAPEGSKIIELSQGTIISEHGLPAEKFKGFARPDSTFKLPLHRLPSSKLAAGILLAAERAWGRDSARLEPEDRELFERAFALVEDVGYPAPGWNEADANVLAFWAKKSSGGKTEFIAIVRVELFPMSVAVVVPATTRASVYSGGTVPGPLLCSVADAGRNGYRSDILQPLARRVYR